MKQTDQVQVRFADGRFEVDGKTCILTCNGKELDLPPQPVAVLCYLIAFRDRYISNDELKNFLDVTEDRSIHKAVSMLRQALGEMRTLIKNKARRGYRFEGPVTPVAPSLRLPTVPSQLNSDPLGSQGIMEDLEIDIDVRVWDPRDVSRFGLSISESGVLPLRKGDKVCVELKANRQVYLYLVWITSDGLAQPLYPWKPGNWQQPLQETPIDRLQLPPLDPDKGYPSGWGVDSPPGIETLAVMASGTPQPVSFHSKLPALLMGFPRHAKAPDPGKGYWFECRDEDCILSEGVRLTFDPEVIPDPLFQIRYMLRNRLGPRFNLIRAVSFAIQAERSRA